jgi:outer membrane protein OmpA-like peptidoglycan-associated protein
MKNIVLFLITISFVLSARAQEYRLKLTPYFGLGLKLPEKQELISGSDQMTQLFTVTKVGTYFDQSGNEVASYNTTNRLGFNLGYDLTKNLEIHGGLNRINIVNSYQVPFNFDVFGFTVATINDTYSHFNVTGGFKYKVDQRIWIHIDGQYAPDYLLTNRIRIKNSSSATAGSYLSSTGDGIKYTGISAEPKVASLYFGVGRKSFLDLNLELGLSLVFKPVSVYDVAYFQNNRKIGNSIINETGSAIFLSVHQPINLGFKKKERKPKPPKPEKVKEPKAEKPKKEEVKKEYEFKDKVVFSGEDIVLNNIKFDQSKDVLKPDGMEELDDVYALLKKYPEAKVLLTGHTSKEGDRKDNINLSRDRAEACKKYLVKKGIKSSRIQAEGLGPDRPLSTTNTELNRRVEIKIF